MTSTTSKGKTCVSLARVWIFLFIFRIDSPGREDTLGFEEGVERKERKEDSNEQKECIRDEGEDLALRCITLTFPP